MFTKTPIKNHGPTQLDRLVPEAGRKAFRAFGFVEAAIVTQWPSIVGALMAEHSLPERLSFPRGKRQGATLYIRVDGAFGLELQHLEPLVIERVNVFFGYGAVAKVALKQGPLPEATRPAKRYQAPLTPAAQQRIDDVVAGVKDPALRRRLAELGAAIMTVPVRRHE